MRWWSTSGRSEGFALSQLSRQQYVDFLARAKDRDFAFVRFQDFLPGDAKIDDNVEAGHNARVGRGASVTGGVVIGGSAVIEAGAWIGINSSIRDGRRVGSRSLVAMDVSVQEDLADDVVARAPRPDVRTRPDSDDRASTGFAGRADPIHHRLA
jgi:UDP-3-O-[3-hydroxymyristoyl] glucosamine N-acyltransferase